MFMVIYLIVVGHFLSPIITVIGRHLLAANGIENQTPFAAIAISIRPVAGVESNDIALTELRDADRLTRFFGSSWVVKSLRRLWS